MYCSCDGRPTETTLFESGTWRISVTDTDHYTVALWRCHVFDCQNRMVTVCQRGMKLYTKLKLISPPPLYLLDWIFMWTATWRQIQIRLIYSTWCVNLLIRRCDVSGEWIIWSISNTFFFCTKTAPEIYTAPISYVLANNGFDFDKLINYDRLVQSWV